MNNPTPDPAKQGEQEVRESHGICKKCSYEHPTILAYCLNCQFEFEDSLTQMQQRIDALLDTLDKVERNLKVMKQEMTPEPPSPYVTLKVLKGLIKEAIALIKEQQK